MQRLTGRTPSPAMVVAIAALVAALGGGAYAATVAKNSVGAKQLKKNAVVTSKIKDSAITDAKVASGAITETRIASGAITLAKLPACPAGTQAINGLCIDSSARPAATWDNAVVGCQDAGGRLPTTGHLVGLRFVLDLGTAGSTNNWVDANHFDGGVSHSIAVTDSGGREQLVTNGANLRPYRCIYELAR